VNHQNLSSFIWSVAGGVQSRVAPHLEGGSDILQYLGHGPAGRYAGQAVRLRPSILAFCPGCVHWPRSSNVGLS